MLLFKLSKISRLLWFTLFSSTQYYLLKECVIRYSIVIGFQEVLDALHFITRVVFLLVRVDSNFIWVLHVNLRYKITKTY